MKIRMRTMPTQNTASTVCDLYFAWRSLRFFCQGTNNLLCDRKVIQATKNILKFA